MSGMRILSHVDGDEVSLVSRAANRRRFLLLKGESGLDAELADILEVPWEREGALLDEIRKDGIQDDTIEQAVIAAVRLLKGVESDLSPELIEKLGSELYGRKNPAINTGSGTGNGGQLTGSGSAEDHFGSASGADLPGSGRDGELSGSGSGAKVAADNDGKDKEPDDDDGDMNKADFSDDDRKNLASQGKALPDGSYPIRNKSDLHNAIQAFGRAKDKGRAKAWIIRRARVLGATNMLPESWGVSKSDDASDIDDVMPSDIEGGDVEFRVPVKKEDGTWDYSGVPEEARDFFSEMIEKADRTEKELEEAREQIAKAADEKLHRDAVAKAAGYSHVAPTDELAPILREAIEKLDPETVEKLEGLLNGAEERIKKGDLFEEMGKRTNSDGANSDSYTEAVKKAAELVEKSDTPLTQDQALARVWDANPDLYAKYLAENGMGVA